MVILLLVAAAAGYFSRWTSPASLFVTLLTACPVFFVFFVLIAHKQTASMLSIAVLVGILLAELGKKQQPRRRKH